LTSQKRRWKRRRGEGEVVRSVVEGPTEARKSVGSRLHFAERERDLSAMTASSRLHLSELLAGTLLLGEETAFGVHR
jgi:hypothetical protein